MKKLVWLRRPGLASTLTPKDGIVHEWITSVAVTIIRIWLFIGKIIRLSTSNKRKLLGDISFDGIIYESNSILWKSEYSYLQYHWCPIDFKVIKGLFNSSNKYNKRKEGKAIKIKVIAGKIVQINSIICPSSKNRLIYLLKSNLDIK